MKVQAAICFEPNHALEVDEIDLEGPKAGEVLVRLAASGVCHTDAYTMSGKDSEGRFPVVLGHEGAGVVEEIGPGVSSVKVGDHVIPLYTPECRNCKYCLSGKTNLCITLRATQGQGVMPDGTSRLSYKGRMLHHYMGTSTFAECTVLPEIAVAKIRKDAPPGKSLSPGLRRHHGDWRRAPYREGRAGLVRRRLRPGRHRARRDPGGRDRRRRPDHRRRPEPEEVRTCASLRRNGLCESEGRRRYRPDPWST